MVKSWGHGKMANNSCKGDSNSEGYLLRIKSTDLARLTVASKFTTLSILERSLEEGVVDWG